MLAVRADLRRPAAAFVSARIAHLVYETAGLSPRTIYGWRLTIAGLGDSTLARRWRAAPEQATPTRWRRQERAHLTFAADTVSARVFVVRLARGEALRWQLRRPSDDTPVLYATLEYRAEAADTWQTLARLSADDQPHRRVIEHAGDYRFVFQPELLAAVRADWAAAAGGSIPMPVKGARSRDIGGGFGVPRDGGARRHEGVDIFAGRGTPVVAVVDGRVSRRTGGLGGEAIFLSGGFGQPSYYYAHLDRFAVADGARVERGEVIGYVGNSGNAAGGPTHLHFGIYAGGGAIDPAAFIRPMPRLPALANRTTDNG
ncbi:M23 family metallopeptidase [Salinisphaera sp. Q1T1-3]|nr:M23 family metallopeptidase [Salinisphaera sp. Q1T1-3]